jgi:hypothetical protein
LALVEREKQRAKNKALREKYGIEVSINELLEFKEVIELKVQSDKCFSDYKKNRTKILREKEIP